MQTDNINKPNHYQGKYGLEAIDVVRNFAGDLSAVEGFYWGNAIKYMLRFQKEKRSWRIKNEQTRSNRTDKKAKNGIRNKIG